MYSIRGHLIKNFSKKSPRAKQTSLSIQLFPVQRCHVVKLLHQYSNNSMIKNKPSYVTARLNLFREIFLKPTKVAMKPRTLQISCFYHLEGGFFYKIDQCYLKSFVLDLQRKPTSDQLNNRMLFQGDNSVIWVLR